MPQILEASLKPEPVAVELPVVVLRPAVSMETKLTRALAAVLRRIGLIGSTTPEAATLLRVADEYSNYRPVLTTDKGELHTPRLTMADVLAKPNPAIDGDLPF